MNATPIDPSQHLDHLGQPISPGDWIIVAYNVLALLPNGMLSVEPPPEMRAKVKARQVPDEITLPAALCELVGRAESGAG